jgi:hypothetical protein
MKTHENFSGKDNNEIEFFYFDKLFQFNENYSTSYINSTPTLGTILNSFTSVASAQSTSNTPGNNAKVYALNRIVNATGTASSGGTLSASAQWSGAIATFRTVTPTTLALSGSGSIGTGGLDLGTGGTFDLTALASGTYTLPSTGSLTGVGTLSGAGHTLAVLGAFQPGNSPGTVTLGPDFTLALALSSTSTFQITSPLYTVGSYDLVNGAGSVVFGGVLELDFSNGDYALGTDVLQIFANTGGFSGDFTAVYSTGLAAGQFATFNADTGSIIIVPEPSSYVLAAIGAGLVGLLHRRRRIAAMRSVQSAR